MITPSMIWCGSPSTSMWSLNVEGSPSSPLTARYRGNTSFGRNDHFCPVPKPAPPRPRRPEVCTSVMMSSGVMASAFFKPSYAPLASAASIVNESSGRSRRNLVMMRVSCAAMSFSCSSPMARSSCAGSAARSLSLTDSRAGDRARHPLACLVLVDQRLGVGTGDRSVELVVDLEDGREVARGDALHLFDGDVGVGGVAPLQVVEEIGAAVDQAAHVGAHRHQQLPHRRPLEHRVEGARPEHDRGREVEEVGDLLDRVGRDVTLLVLREVQQRQHRRLLLRVLRDGLAREVEVRRRERH